MGRVITQWVQVGSGSCNSNKPPPHPGMFTMPAGDAPGTGDSTGLCANRGSVLAPARGLLSPAQPPRLLLHFFCPENSVLILSPLLEKGQDPPRHTQHHKALWPKIILSGRRLKKKNRGRSSLPPPFLHKTLGISFPSLKISVCEGVLTTAETALAAPEGFGLRNKPHSTSFTDHCSHLPTSHLPPGGPTLPFPLPCHFSRLCHALLKWHKCPWV